MCTYDVIFTPISKWKIELKRGYSRPNIETKRETNRISNNTIIIYYRFLDTLSTTNIVCEWKSHDKSKWASIGCWMLNNIITIWFFESIRIHIKGFVQFDLVTSSFSFFFCDLLSIPNRIHFAPYLSYLCALHVLIEAKATVKIKTACVRSYINQFIIDQIFYFIFCWIFSFCFFLYIDVPNKVIL